MKHYTQLLQDQRRFKRQRPPVPTYLEVAGCELNEGTWTSILAFFLDPQGEHGLGSLVLDVLLSLFDHHGHNGEATVTQEVRIPSGKQIDLLIETPTHIIVIENKVRHQPVNPFDEYYRFAQSLNSSNDRVVLGILLSIEATALADNAHFKCLTHGQFLKSLRTALEASPLVHPGSLRWILEDFMETVRRVIGGSSMDPEWLAFVADNYDHLDELLAGIAVLRKELRAKVSALRSLVDVTEYENVDQWMYRETGLFDMLVHDITYDSGEVLGINTGLAAAGWSITFFYRSPYDNVDVRVRLRTAGIPFDEGSRPAYCRRFPYQEQLPVIQEHIETILQKLSGANA